MSIKLKMGQAIALIVDDAVKLNYRLLPFIPHGRILALDLKRTGIQPTVIFDVGANIGQTAKRFNKHFPAATIYSFEPVKDTYKELLANTSKPNIKCFNMALSAEKTTMTIHKAGSYSGAASLKAAPSADPLDELIEVNTGQNISREYNITDIDLLKTDTEGFELQVLKGFGPMLKDHVKFIYAEVGFDTNDPFKTHITDLLSYLSGVGFIVSGFYEPYRYGRNKLKLNHQDILLTNTTLVEI